MAMSGFTKDMNIIQKLNDEPNDRDGLTAGELKAKFDEGGLAVKDYLINTVKPFADGLEEETETHKANAVRHITASERTAWNNKVDKVTGKGLSTNDYTTAEKNKLAGIEAQANKYVHPSYTARTGKPTGNLTPGFGGSVTVSQITSDATGHVTGATDRTITIPSAAATTSAAGLMSAADKTKLNGIAAGAQVNSITGVKGNAESSYRTGNVNLTPANIGAAAANHSHAMSDVTGLTTAVQYGPAGIVGFQGSEDFPLAGCVAEITPVQAGSGDPSPTNVRAIFGRTGANVTHASGKNLLNQRNPLAVHDSLVWTNDTALFSGTGTWRDCRYPHMGLHAGTAYTLSCHIKIITAPANGCKPAIAIRNASTNGIIVSDSIASGATEADLQLSYTPNSDLRCYVSILITDGGGGSASVEFSKLQLEIGSAKTAYEAFVGTVYDVTFPSSAGTVYGGTLDVLTGVLTVTHGMAAMDSLTWSLATTGVFTSTSLGSTIKKGVVQNWMSSMFRTDTTTSFSYSIVSSLQDLTLYKSNATASNTVVYCKATQYTSLAAFQSAIAGQTLVYPLENPITYQLTPQQVTAVAGSNHVWADTGDVTVEYGAFPGALQRELNRHYVTAGKMPESELGVHATAEGTDTIASGTNSHAEGAGSFAFGAGAHAEGSGTKAYLVAHSEGVDTIAYGEASHAEGFGTIANGSPQHVFGKHNIADTSNVEIVGWGSSDSNRKNIRTLDRSGNMTIAGTLTQSSDARLKDVEGEIPDVSGIRAVRFKWNDANGEHDDKDHIGYLAQDVEVIAPFLVGEDSNGYKSLDYIALLCAKVEMLAREVRRLRAAAEGGD